MEDNTYLLSKTEDYKDNDKLYFTYKQQGHLGIQQSKIIGTFHIRYPTNSPLKAENIDIVFSGKGFVQWNEGNKINYAEKKIFEYSTCVYNRNELGEKLSYLDLPFEFKVPENIPSSIPSIPSKLTSHLGKARICYSIKAIITKKRNQFKLLGSKKIVEIKCPIRNYVQQKDIEKQEPVKLIKNFNNNDYSILFKKTKFDQNDIINVPLNMIFKNGKGNNENLNDIKKIKISLKEYYQLKVENKSHLVKNNLFNNIIPKEKFSHVDNSLFNEYFVSCKLYLNEKGIRCSAKTDLVNIWHQVNIDILLKKRRRIRFEKIVDIVNAIDKNINEELEEEEEMHFH